MQKILSKIAAHFSQDRSGQKGILGTNISDRAAPLNIMTASSLQQTLKRVLCEQPLTFLDPVFYTNPDLIELEQQNIFSKTWLYAGHTATLGEPGSVITAEVAGRSLLIMRSEEGDIAAFHNACSHRGSALRNSDQPTATKCLVCPYHGWTFNTKGELKGLPEKEHFASGVDFSKHSLKSVRLETWGPLMFVSLNQSAPPLSEFLGEAIALMAGFPMDSLTLLFSGDYELKCNWKTFHDNGLCDYHVNIAHQKTLKDIQGKIKDYEYVFGDYINALVTPTTASWRADNKLWDALDDPFRSRFVTFGIFPNLHVYALPDGTLYVERIDAISTHSCRMHGEVYGLPHHLKSVDTIKQWYDELFAEDKVLAEAVQKGYVSIRRESASASFTPGPINYLESRVIHQQQLIRRFLLSGLPQEMATPIGSTYSDIFQRSKAFGQFVRRPSLSP